MGAWTTSKDDNKGAWTNTKDDDETTTDDHDKEDSDEDDNDEEDDEDARPNSMPSPSTEIKLLSVMMMHRRSES